MKRSLPLFGHNKNFATFGTRFNKISSSSSESELDVSISELCKLFSQSSELESESVSELESQF